MDQFKERGDRVMKIYDKLTERSDKKIIFLALSEIFRHVSDQRGVDEEALLCVLQERAGEE
jgi:hypothetical protein